MTAKPDAFLSYTRFDDRHGKISEFRTWLSDAIEEVSGHPFDIFQDIEGIGLGKKWQNVLDEMLDQARFFIPILTPKFFNSAPCRDELSKFLDLESKTGRQDLVLPIYWTTCSVLEDEHLKASDKLAQAIDKRQRWNWRDLRLEPFESKVVQSDLLALGAEIECVRRNVPQLIENPKEIIATGKPKPSVMPAPMPSIVSPRPKPAQALFSQQSTPDSPFKDIYAPWCPEMVLLPPGSFVMGSPETEKDRRDNEGPQHEVEINHPFALGRYPVTFDEYDHFCDETNREKPNDNGWGRKGWRPVINVSHGDAEAYCMWLSELTQATYQLPTEAMWEYGCRAGTTTAYAFGNSLAREQANFGHQIYQTSQVDSYPANGWGLHDMHGNVWEWCADCYYDGYEGSSDDGSARLLPIPRRVLRGGSWEDSLWDARSASRLDIDSVARSDSIGFRCARVQEK